MQYFITFFNAKYIAVLMRFKDLIDQIYQSRVTVLCNLNNSEMKCPVILAQWLNAIFYLHFLFLKKRNMRFFSKALEMCNVPLNPSSPPPKKKQKTKKHLCLWSYIYLNRRNYNWQSNLSSASEISSVQMYPQWLILTTPDESQPCSFFLIIVILSKHSQIFNCSVLYFQGWMLQRKRLSPFFKERKKWSLVNILLCHFPCYTKLIADYSLANITLIFSRFFSVLLFNCNHRMEWTKEVWQFYLLSREFSTHKLMKLSLFLSCIWCSVFSSLQLLHTCAIERPNYNNCG